MGLNSLCSPSPASQQPGRGDHTSPPPIWQQFLKFTAFSSKIQKLLQGLTRTLKSSWQQTCQVLITFPQGLQLRNRSTHRVLSPNRPI